jgi:hypothetical protein
VSGRGDATSTPRADREPDRDDASNGDRHPHRHADRRPSPKAVLLAVAIGCIVLFAAGAVVQRATRNTDAVSFRGGRYVDPVALTRAQVEHDYGRFRRTPGRIDGRHVLVPTRNPVADPPRLLFVIDANGRTGVLYGLSK